jgi:hypothetical protein
MIPSQSQKRIYNHFGGFLYGHRSYFRSLGSGKRCQTDMLKIIGATRIHDRYFRRDYGTTHALQLRKNRPIYSIDRQLCPKGIWTMKTLQYLKSFGTLIRQQ